MKPSKHIPVRSCIVCGTKAAQGDLLRLVRTATGAVKVDSKGRSAGRGAYLCTTKACRHGALRRPARLEHVLRVDLPSQERTRLAQILESLRE